MILCRLKFIALVLVLLIAGCKPNTPPPFGAIAHAGGGYDNRNYTNSIEALNHNYARGFRLFEIDFIWTSDDHLVCLHDWDKTPKWLLNYRDEKALSLEQFNEMNRANPEVTPCNLISLNEWLKSHPNAHVVSDIRGNNLRGLVQMRKIIEQAEQRIIPQIRQPEEYTQVKYLGFHHIIWTLHSFQSDQEELLRYAGILNLFAITMPPDRAKEGLAQSLKPLGTPTYVHTINDPEEVRNYQNTYGVTSVYTDFLSTDLQTAEGAPN